MQRQTESAEGYRTQSLRSTGAVAGLLAAALIGGCGPGQEPAPPQPRLVRFEAVSLSEGGRSRNFSGIAQSSAEPRLSFKVAGTVVHLPAGVGDRVRAGQLIAELDPADQQLQVEDAEASLRRAEAEARNAQAIFSRTRDLYENANASRTDFDAARTASESARAGVASVGKRLELARRQLSYTRLLAPVAGAIAEVAVEVNENVQAGQPIVRMLASAATLEVVLAMPESLIPQVRKGDEVSASFDAIPGQQLSAVVNEVGVAATASGTTFPVTVQLTDSHPDLRAGMAAEVTFRFESVAQGQNIRLSTHLVTEDREGRFVFVVEPREGGLATVRRRAVTIGELTSDGLEILEGLADGDRVVTAGVASLSDGEIVRIPRALPGQAAAGAELP